MENISYVGLSQQIALQREMDVTANNLANMNTPGFKGQGIMFLEYLNKAKNTEAGGDTLKQVMDFSTYRDLATGPMQQTFNKLDFAIGGEGYFAVQASDGIKYTRDGGFSLNSQREIVDKQGRPVMSEGGGPIAIPADAGQITVTPKGDVATEQGLLGRLKVVTFEDPQGLKPVGDNLYDAGDMAEKPVEDPRVQQGMIEGSNVNPIVEMNRMVEVLRMYQATQRMLLADHDRIRTAIQKLAKA